MKTTQETEGRSQSLAKRLSREFWSPLNQVLYPNGEICSEIKTCNFFKRETLGYEILVCETYPNACEKNPFQVNREHEKIK